ncbi:MAG: FAD-binding oxidoreductase [Chloroflexota bacterium]
MSAVQIRSVTGTAQGIDAAAVESFQAALRGDLLRPGDTAYDDARRVYNGMIDRRPALIACCADVADVIAAVTFAREHGLAPSVRGGGHNVTGFAVCDGGLVIDLSPMKGIRVDPQARTARAEGGCTWGDLDHATHAFGLAAPGGIVSTTGIAGLTLGGGIGYLTRMAGLSCDNLLSADVVTADGHLLTASADQHPDLFWALRGGGGNFGIVTSFEFRLHPVSTVYAGPILWPLDRAADAMRFYRDYLAQTPGDMNALFVYLKVPPGPPFPEALHNRNMCGVVCCYAGPDDQAEATVRPLLEFGPPAFSFLGRMPYPVLQSLFDDLVPFSLQNYWKADFVNDLSEELIAEHVRYGPGVPTINSGVHIFPVSGVAQRVRNDETAYSYREARFVHVLYAIHPDPADTPKHVAWVRDYWSALHPHSSGGAYVNFLTDEGQERVVQAYRENYPRLAAIKHQYDPTNLFRMNQNIVPAP